MNKKGLHLEIPGWGERRLQQALFDLNGTLALDGILPEAVRERVWRLQETLALYVVTADIHGTAADLTRDCGDLKIARVQAGDEAGKNMLCLRISKLQIRSPLAMMPMMH